MGIVTLCSEHIVAAVTFLTMGVMFALWKGLSTHMNSTCSIIEEEAYRPFPKCRHVRRPRHSL